MQVKLNSDERVDYILKDRIQIIQTNDSFAFSLDTLLLGHFAAEFIHDNHKVADLCAGNGAASLFLAAQNKAKYDLVEIQPKMADIARRSILLNALEDHLLVHEADVNDAFSFLAKDTYDVVVCNPPYFKVPAGHTVNPDEAKAIARHEIKINLEQVIQTASGLLKTRGKFFMVHRPERLNEIILGMQKYNLTIKYIQPFIPKTGKDTNLIVLQATKNSNPEGLILKNDIIVHNENDEYTKEIWDMIDGE